MSFKNWAKNSRNQLHQYGIFNGLKATYGSLRSGITARATERIFQDIGISIFQREWDSLIVLDACRPDALQEVSDEYSFLPETVPSVYSNASWSSQWLQRNFTDKESVSSLAHITANGYASGFEDGSYNIDDTDFHTFVDAWRYESDNFSGTPPRVVTDYTIQTLRREDTDRFIAHYMQPHAPYRRIEIDNEFSEYKNNGIWELIRAGIITEETAYDIYLDNLRWVLDDIELLLENINAQSIILTADHAELFGEYGLYGHPRKCHLKELRRVPWVTLSATDTGAHQPEYKLTDARNSTTEEQLQALGYK